MAETSKRTHKLNFIQMLVIVGVFSLVLIIALIGYATYRYLHTNRAAVTTRQTVLNDGNLSTTSAEDAITKVADTVSPSIVSIVTNVTTQTIFGAAQQQAAGTGIIVSKDGYILTNKHVVSGANAVQVILSDGTTYQTVKVVGTDPLNDVAFLKVDGVSDLTPATLGDSSTTRVGQTVVAIGNSLGQYQNTVTSGIISGKGRPITAGESGSPSASETLTDLLQTDAAINPGNSGGPLLNRSGQVIGINTAVAANAEGVGFAIPINATKGALKSVLAGKGVVRSYLGVRYATVTAAVAKQYNLSAKEGAYVIGNNDNQSGIQTGGPADKAGIKDKDIITKINGLVVGPQGGVSSLVGEYAPGETIEVTVMRSGKEITVKVTLEAYPSF